MKKIILKTSLLSIFISIGSAHAAIQNDEPRIVGYYANWSAVPFTALPVKNINVMNYAFASLQDDGSIKLIGNKDDANFKDIQKLKQQNPNLKVLLSIGGWTLSKSFSTVAANKTTAQKFAENIANLMKQYPDLDGIDIDWEYPVSGGDNIPHRPEDKQNYVTLVKEIRTKLDALNTKHYFITIAGPHHDNQLDGGSVSNLVVKNMLQFIDWINIMDYDIHQSTSEPTVTNNDAALYQSPNNTSASKGHDSVDDSINDYKKQGLTPAEVKQLVMGIPLYGFGWSGVFANGTEPLNPGLYAQASGKLPNAYAQGSDGIFTYVDIMNHLITDQALKASWNDQYKFATYFSDTKNSFLTFDDVQTVNAKADYIKQNKLGGAMFWELSNDTVDKNSLVYNMCGQLRNDPSSCVLPVQPPIAKMKLELTNNDPKNPITISLVTSDKSAYYAFPLLSPQGQAGSNVMYDDKNSWNVEQVMDKNGLLVLLTTTTGQQRWCPGSLNMQGNTYHHIQVYYDNVPNCAIN